MTTLTNGSASLICHRLRCSRGGETPARVRSRARGGRPSQLPRAGLQPQQTRALRTRTARRTGGLRRRRGGVLPVVAGLSLRPDRVRDERDEAAVPADADAAGTAGLADPRLRL